MKPIPLAGNKGKRIGSGTVYRSDMFLYAKRKGGPPLSAHIKHRTVALIRTEILRKICVELFFIQPVPIFT